MKDLVRRFTESLVRLVRPVSVHVHPYSCVYVAGPTARRTGERPPRGEDSPLVRPYVEAHERRVAEERRLRVRRSGVRIAVYGVNVDPRLMRGTGAAA